MYAIFQTGGKQYKASLGDLVKVEKLPGEAGSEVALDRVLAVGTDEGINLGKPFLDGTSVQATLVRTARDRKIVVFKKKRRKAFHKKQGHHQWYSVLRIDAIRSQGKPAETEAPTGTTSEAIPQA